MSAMEFIQIWRVELNIAADVKYTGCEDISYCDKSIVN